ncbi:hypothetical protein FE257_011537 [Aspergillus nanangensis]|uniref:tRNA wybutosine-synthesizing protein 2 n=1 Tax=Aspergillus nanangensis TaxID=2582783 RepID=A0AAD4GRC7_ASPNN|nr:hypothetical protein FE257_011537 [Aspergillus nanangensis]
MLLLPANAFQSPPAWGSIYKALNGDQKRALYASISSAFSRLGVTHVAINAPIVLTDTLGQENRMRSPVGLIPLHGDFGPLPSRDREDIQPNIDDFQRAFWVRTVQNHGIVQTWAPLYTMFSRGNITEKARILGHGNTFEGLDVHSLRGDTVVDVSVVDMYAGIGYFVFSYLKRGVSRVWGWEINGWSVEGLRRGCIANGWNCKVIRVDRDGRSSESIPDLVGNLREEDRVVVFHGDNRFAAHIMNEVQNLMTNGQSWSRIRHVNLGLLPSSGDAWHNACRLIDNEKGGWIHVHENVNMQQVEEKKEQVTREVGRLRSKILGYPSPAESVAACRHIEHVKTYAPGVMHCVFDIELLPHSEV